MTSVRPRSRAKWIACTAANASTSSKEGERVMFSERDVMTLPRLSWITTPRPVVFNSLKITPSKLILRNGVGEGCQRTRAKGWVRGGALVLGLHQITSSEAWESDEIIWEIGYSLEFVRSWFLQYQIAQTNIKKVSRSLPSSLMYWNKSWKLAKSLDWRNNQLREESHKGEKVGQP